MKTLTRINRNVNIYTDLHYTGKTFTLDELKKMYVETILERENYNMRGGDEYLDIYENDCYQYTIIFTE